ncbi:MAG: hypothetical protein ACE5QF_06995 [Thermoplasmata archaeon]
MKQLQGDANANRTIRKHRRGGAMTRRKRRWRFYVYEGIVAGLVIAMFVTAFLAALVALGDPPRAYFGWTVGLIFLSLSDFE